VLYLRAPNHLGDGVMALPVVEALRRLGPLTVAAPSWGDFLYGHLDVRVTARGSVPFAEAAVLLPPSFRTAWEARKLPVRVGYRSDFRSWLLTHALEPVDEHRGRSYARLAAVLGADVKGPPTLPRPDVQSDGHVALIPVSPSGAPVMWPGFEELGDLLGHAVVYTGPGEHAQTRLPVRAGLPLPELVEHLAQARAVVSNDSGVAHLARALGLRTLVIYGSTDPERTGPPGSEALVGPRLDCTPCYRKTCKIGGAPCLEVPVERVLEALG